MQRGEQQWTKMQQELNRLRKQNQELKRLLQLQVKNEPKICHKRQFQSYKQNECSIKMERQPISSNKNINELRQEWAQWSNRLEASIVSKNNRIRHNTEIEDVRKTSIMMSGGSFGGEEGFYVRKSLESLRNKNNSDQFINLELKSPGKSQIMDQNLSLIEDIFLFGPSISDIQSAEQRKFSCNHQLYYPLAQKESFQVYGNYLFPNQLQVKHIRQKNHGVEVNKMIFKNNKKLDCKIFIFQGQQSNQKLSKQNKLLDKVNPSKWLYALSIQFSDFVSVRNQKITSSKINKTYSMVSETNDNRYMEGDIVMEKEFGTGKKNLQTEEQIFKSNFCLCIMTYFPFIRFLKDILIEVFDSVKLRRMNKYSNCSAFKQIDIYFFIEELKQQLAKFLNDNLKIPPEINQNYEFPLNQVQMKLDLKQNDLINQIIGDWGFKILKILDKQSLLDIFCYIMLQESICFLSQDRNILTFVILLYVVVFTLPFGYPHPCVSVIFNQQLLQTPFTAVLGVNKGTKWLQQNLQSLTQNKQNKLIVNLNEEQVKIKFKKKPRTHKSQRLKKIFTNFYRKIQTSAIPSIFKKKIELISRQTTKQQNQHAVTLVTQIQQYFHQQLLSHLPNREIIQLIKQSFLGGDNTQMQNPNTVYHIVIEKIERYLGESRKSKNKDKDRDTFIDQLIKKQLFRVYIDRLYQIQ